ncbi:MAG: 2-ketoisovalerate ferredoxin oxidoreductase subunit delta [Bacteroidetes bacterium ADurb.Bin302]|nr:MAG: 2-ketoisovalerate ferredoxin oxidoreductase subunit delta [Bacteroidetes bacterium ADurb.Bin302]
MNPKTKIAIASGKGGTGKTFVSTNLFNVLQKRDLNIALVDCDAEEPNDREFIRAELQISHTVTQKVPVIDESKCSYCGKCKEYCNYNAIFFLKDTKMIKVLDELCHGCGACSVVCADNAIVEKDDILGSVNQYGVSANSVLIEARMNVGVYSPVNVIKSAIKKANGYDIILLDSPPGTSCPFIQTVATADYVVLVTEPTPFGLSDLMQSVDTLRGMGKSCGVIINRADLGNKDIYDYLKFENIPLLMTVPFDKRIAFSYSNGELLTNLYSDWDLKFHQLYHTITEQYGNSNH